MLPLGKQFDAKENRGRKSFFPDTLPIIKVSEIINIFKKVFLCLLHRLLCVLPIQRSIWSDMIVQMNSYFY